MNGCHVCHRSPAYPGSDPRHVGKLFRHGAWSSPKYSGGKWYCRFHIPIITADTRSLGEKIRQFLKTKKS